MRYHRMLNQLGALFLAVLLLANCAVSPSFGTNIAPINQWLERDIDENSPSTRRSNVIVHLQQATSDGVLVLYSYTRERQESPERMTCVQPLVAQGQAWAPTDHPDCMYVPA